MTSILISIKKLLGIAAADTNFDGDIIVHINSTFSVLTQLGVGPAAGFSITGETDVWTDFMAANAKLELIKSYMFLKVRLLFDPPTSSAVAEVYKQQISELEWRIMVIADPVITG